MSEFKTETLNGISWSAIANLVNQGFQFVTTVFLARLLNPEDFGLIAMTHVFTGFAHLFIDVGLGAALIQNQQVEERHYSSVFWLNLASGFVLMVCVAASAPLVAAFYSEPRLSPLTMFIALHFFTGSFSMVQIAILRRTFNFRLLAVIQIVSFLVADAGAITLAFMGYGVWSLAWQSLLATVIQAGATWMLTGWRPRFYIEKQAIQDLFKFSSNALGFSASTYWIRYADNLLIGKFIGPAGLGVYARAYNLMLLPVRELSSVISRVMFPALSKIQDDKQRIKRIYLRAMSAIALFIFPLMWGLLVVSDAFILAVYGPKWQAVVPILRILCLVGLAQSMAATTNWLFLSQGRSDWMFRWGIAAGLVTLLAFGISIQWGVTAVAIAYAITTIPLTYFVFYLAGKLIDMPFSDVIQAVSGTFGCAIGMAVLMWAIRHILPTDWSPWAYLAVQVPFGMLVYFLLVHLSNLSAYQIVRDLAVERWQLRRGRQLRCSEAL